MGCGGGALCPEASIAWAAYAQGGLVLAPSVAVNPPVIPIPDANWIIQDPAGDTFQLNGLNNGTIQPIKDGLYVVWQAVQWGFAGGPGINFDRESHCVAVTGGGAGLAVTEPYAGWNTGETYAPPTGAVFPFVFAQASTSQTVYTSYITVNFFGFGVGYRHNAGGNHTVDAKFVIVRLADSDSGIPF